MFEGLVTTLLLFYSLNEPYATVRFSGDNDPGLLFHLIHQTTMWKESGIEAYADLYDFLGSEASPRFDVEDKEVLIVVAKRHDRIVASGVFEVDFSMTAQGYLLAPRGGFNLLCDQNEMIEPESVKEERPTIPVMHSCMLLPWYA